MFKWHEFSKPAYALSGCQVFSGERAAVLLTLMSACLSGMFKWHVCSKPAYTGTGCQVFIGERVAVLLTLMLACLNGMFDRSLHKHDLAVWYSVGSVQLCCSRSCWHV